MIPSVLPAPAPGWTTETDVVVIGSGIAGLVAALRCRPHGRVLLVTKALLDAGSTRWAQGGIAAALDPADSPAEHLADTLTAGVGLCDAGAVRAMVTEGPDAVRDLADLGAVFDRAAGGEIALTREGGHHRDRVAHAGGDATGAEISRALRAALKDSGVDVIEHALVLDLLKDAQGCAAGVTLHVMGEGQPGGAGAVRARAVVLATGGLGQVFSATTNPEVSTGDGVALALRAGAAVTDLEFVQFHPTVLWLGPDARGRQPLVSEAVRGEGAHLVDRAGVRFMTGRHELGELAPRDVVAKGIMNRMRETGEPCMLLDGRHLGAATWARRFPTILAACRDHGIDPVTEPIPVVPAAHYASGGVRTDLHGRTSVPGLYACGEVACTGVHGANRLASNSLLEGLVFARRIADAIGADRAAEPGPFQIVPDGSRLLDPALRGEIQRIMTAYAGVLRRGDGLATAARELAALAAPAGTPDSAPSDAPSAAAPGDVAADAAGTGAAAPGDVAAGDVAAGHAAAGHAAASAGGAGHAVPADVTGADVTGAAGAGHAMPGTAVPGHAAPGAGVAGGAAPVAPGVEAWEVTNLHTIASAIVAAALRREETRGSHWREDFPERADARWRGHLVTRLTGNALTTTYEPGTGPADGDHA